MNAAEFAKIHAEIIEHLTAGGLVQITNYLHSTLYKSQHVSFFSVDDKGVYVKQGKHTNRIVGAVGPLVQIRFGKLV